MKERVLITGASGFVGHHLVEAAVQAGLEVYAAVRPSSDVAHLEPFGIRYTSLDFSNTEALVKELEEKQYHYIIHAAGITKAKTEQEYIQVNAGYTQKLALAATKAAIPLRKFVFISSLAALGPVVYNEATPIHEQNKPQPVTAYGKSKLLAEQYLAEIKDLPLVVLRPTAVYGPREKDIFIILKTLNLGLEPYISNKPQWLSFVYVKDLTKAVIQSLGAGINHAAYNVSDGNSYDRYALATITKRILGKKSIRFHVPMGVVNVMARLLEAAYASSSKMPALNQEKLNELAAENWNCSIERIRQDLGFVPEYDLEKGLAQTLKWYKENNWL
ncbi:NAD-dependent epimerase/dehydratase family protein [Pontibacter sp. HSC-14F20]|uniref:NAD-dependent epimerase/dehydratase family protein n=1 Tax=Pontibacter sp. HSC-14F20 TaxID=2864136 RepID=UPI001C72D86A|nr:NAD-dependent epimerase/dehydratase family protein [Pontibacter sp. HSC-14F20]MBX0334272.1 NAD-dependent epimerase/dehydratase family protein [Pontibacter sp. HSC-14F20]